MRASRLAVASALTALAVALALLAYDLVAWDEALTQGDRTYAVDPSDARWSATTVLPHDPAGAFLRVGDPVALRRAVRSFVVSVDVPRGLDNGLRRAQLRARADVALTGVVASGDPSAASQAANLAGVLAETALEGTATDRGRAAFEAAVRADPTNADAAYNLELILRRAKVVGTREGPGSGSGPRGQAEPGAGSGQPGEGY